MDGKTQSEMFIVLSLLTEKVRPISWCGAATTRPVSRRGRSTTGSTRRRAAWREVIRPMKIKDMRGAGKAMTRGKARLWR